MSEQNHYIYEFGPFRLDAQKRLLVREGAPVKLFPKEFDTLLALVEHSGEVLDKDELMQRVWPDAIVEEGNLTTNISHLRKALNEKPHQHQYIVTVPGQGYRFVAGVKAVFDELVVHERTRASVTIEEEETPTREEDRSIVALWSASRFRLPALLASCALLVVLAATGYYFRAKQAAPPAPATPLKSIAVLPFKPLVAESRDESLEMGMADTLITRLSSIREIVVRPTSSVRRYTRLEQDAVAAGREQRVDAVLEGSIQKSGERIRITVRLVNVGDGQQLWVGRFDEKFTDIFTLQDSISERVAGVLAVGLTGEERMLLTKRYTGNTEAYRLYLKGLYYSAKSTEEGLKKAIEHFRQALDIDPGYALAYAGLSESYSQLGVFGLMPMKESSSKAKEAATRALEMDDNLGQTHASLAVITMDYYWDWAEAERQFKRAIDLNPNYAPIRTSYSWYLTRVGRSDEAIQEAKRAQELDPVSPDSNATLGFAFLFARQYDQAIEHFGETLEFDPNYLVAHAGLGVAYALKGMHEEAISEFQKARTISGGSTDMTALLGYAYAVAGQRSEAEKILEESNQLSRQRYVSPSHRAIIYTGLGEKELAFEWLEKAYEDRNWVLVLLKVHPMFDPLRSDPRFLDLLRRMNLTP